jgi:hypothetical protein
VKCKAHRSVEAIAVCTVCGLGSCGPCRISLSEFHHLKDHCRSCAVDSFLQRAWSGVLLVVLFAVAYQGAKELIHGPLNLPLLLQKYRVLVMALGVGITWLLARSAGAVWALFRLRH